MKQETDSEDEEMNLVDELEEDRDNNKATASTTAQQVQHPQPRQPRISNTPGFPVDGTRPRRRPLHTRNPNTLLITDLMR